MTMIKNGYGDKPTHIKFETSAGFDTSAGGEMTIGLWIEQDGLPKYSENSRGAVSRIGEGVDTLAYMTINEAITLRTELNAALKEVLGV